MARRPAIGITCYGRDERGRFSLPAAYVDAVRRAGGLPVLLPPGERRPEEWLERVDAVVLAGGGDLDPALYGGRPHPCVEAVDAERDASELALAREVLARELPCLCVCRGLQVLSVALGGTLLEHLPEAIGETVLHRLPPREAVRHPVAVEPGSRLAQVLGTTALCPWSAHHQAVRDLPEGFVVAARAPDGVVEAIEDPSRPWLLAVQWHPELSAGTDPEEERLVAALVEQAAARAARSG